MKIWVWTALAATLVAACGEEANGSAQDERESDRTETMPMSEDAAPQPMSSPQAQAYTEVRAEADFIGTDGEVIGTVSASPGPFGMILRLEAEGIAEGWHAAHLHKVGDCSDPEAGFKASGSHINISDREHGLLNSAGYHTGADFPNLYASREGIRGELFAGGLMLDQANDEDGFALILHENEDDHRTQPIGGAGGRIACAAFSN
ncbi:MAG: superoxide dismutase family protein [Parvularcula sp.]|jgi:Cu-Zn family superoxide dismutase|nr:superoxide dismutase family protein [Parvularcula sp.]